MDAIYRKLEEIFRDQLDNDDIKLSSTTTMNDIEEWDSLNNIQIVVEVEKKFKVKFTTGEIHKWANVGEMAKSIESKIK